MITGEQVDMRLSDGQVVSFVVSTEGAQVSLVRRYPEGARRETFTAFEAAQLGAALIRASGHVSYSQ